MHWPYLVIARYAYQDSVCKNGAAPSKRFFGFCSLFEFPVFGAEMKYGSFGILGVEDSIGGCCCLLLIGLRGQLVGRLAA